MKLGDFLWWPKAWTSDDISSYRTAPAHEFRQDGILAGCGLTRNGLVMQVHYHGQTLVGRVTQSSINTPADMQAICDFLSEHLGESIGKIEDIEVHPHRF